MYLHTSAQIAVYPKDTLAQFHNFFTWVEVQSPQEHVGVKAWSTTLWFTLFGEINT